MHNFGMLDGPFCILEFKILKSIFCFLSKVEEDLLKRLFVHYCVADLFLMYSFVDSLYEIDALALFQIKDFLFKIKVFAQLICEARYQIFRVHTNFGPYFEKMLQKYFLPCGFRYLVNVCFESLFLSNRRSIKESPLLIWISSFGENKRFGWLLH